VRAVVQRVSEAVVRVDGETVGQCGRGLVVLVAAHKEDALANAAKMADRVMGLRIFNDGDGKMNLSIRDLMAQGEPVGVLAVSNFTVYGETAKNRRPSFIDAAAYEKGRILFDAFVSELRGLGCRTETGEFGADMQVSLINDGPVTVILDA
jgi:D-tyrosyl-tRNA(Tyr) deacylase